MPAVLAHTGIMLLARDRVADIRDRLLLKKALATVPLTDLELRVLRLATLTHTMMSDSDDTREAIILPPSADWPDGIGRGVSRMCVLGCMGPDIPGLSAIMAPAQSVWFDTVHKGTPDGSREQINARTHDFAMEIWRRGSLALTERPNGTPEAARAMDRARNQIRAYVLGHLTHLAGDIIAHPFIFDVEAHVPAATEAAKFTHAKTEGSLDSRVAVEFFRREGPRSGQAWSAYWPTLDEMPPEVFVGWEQAIARIYRIGDDRAKGLGAFEAAIALPPVPDADFIRDGFNMMTKGGVGIIYNWGYASWLGFMSVAFLPVLATFPLAFALPNGNDWFEKQASELSERSKFEALALPLALNSIWPVIYGAVIASITWRGVEGLATAGLLGASVSALFGFIYLVTLATPDPGAGFRWVLMFALPAAIGLALAVTAIVKRAQGQRRKAIFALLLSGPFLMFAASAVLLYVFAEVVGGADETAGTISWAILSGLFGVVGLILLFWLPFKARDARVPEEAPAFPALRPHHVRLFDKSPLFELPNQQDATLRELHYPSGKRPLLKLWWTGQGDFFIRPRRTHIEYVFAQDGSSPGIIPAPISPMTQRQLAAYLTNAVRDSANATNVLNCALVHEADGDVEIPPGAAFADHGDVAESKKSEAPEFALTEAANEFKKLSRENNDSSYVLLHSPKRAQAVRFDRFGPVAFDARETETVRGAGNISGSGTTITGVATQFRSFFQPGDRVVFNGQTRIVTKIDSDQTMVISSAFRPAPDHAAYDRVGTTREQERGYSFVARPRPRSGTGDTIMDIAGDLGALFCMSGASQMLDSTEQKIPDLANLVDAGGNAPRFPDLGPAVQVFRNWCLDRRLVEEWREAVIGGATVDTTPPATVGDRILAQQGWIPTLRKWLRVVDTHGASAVSTTLHDAGPNEPTNQELSFAMAKLFSMSEPVVMTARP